MNETQYAFKERINKLIDGIVDSFVDWDTQKLEGILETGLIVLKDYNKRFIGDKK